MKNAFGEYRRLARSALGFSSLWQGEDHLLFVKGSGFLLPFSEEYKRFRYGEIQGLVLSRTSGLLLEGIGYLLALAITGSLGFALLFFRSPDDVLLLATTLLLVLPFFVLVLILLIRHFLLGPRCRLDLQTAQKVERLTAVNRLHLGRETLERLAPTIRAAQASVAIPTEVGGSPEAPAQPERRSEAGSGLRLPFLSRPSFGAAVAFAVGLLILLHLPNPVVSGLVLGVAVIGAIPLMVALAGSVRQRAPDSVRAALWAQLVCGLLLSSFLGVYYLNQAINDPSLTLGIGGPITAIAEISILGGLGFYLLFLGGALAHLTVALYGIVQTNRWQQRLQDPPPGGDGNDHSVPSAPST